MCRRGFRTTYIREGWTRSEISNYFGLLSVYACSDGFSRLSYKAGINRSTGCNLAELGVVSAWERTRT